MKKLLYILPLLFILAGCKNNFSQIENFPNQNDADVYTVSGSVCALACPPSSALPSSLINEAMNNSRAAVPSNGEISSYTIKATNIKDKNGNEIESENPKVVNGTVSSGKFTLKLTALGTWRIELQGTGSYSNYKGTIDITLTNELSNITDIVVYAFYTGNVSSGSGTGQIALPINIDENTGITEWSYKLIDSSGGWESYTDGGILTPISYSNGKYFINISKNDKTAGVYDLKFTFKKQNDVVYECTEKINVISGKTTDTWLISSSTDGIVSENEAKHLHKLPNGKIEFRITSDIISEPNKNFSTQYYVNPSDTTVTFGEGSNAETFPAGNDDTGLGTKAAPYKTINKALNVINAVNDGISEYTIILLADSEASDSISGYVGYLVLNSSIIINDLNLKLTSYKTIAGVQKNFKIDAASKNRVIYVGGTPKNVRLTLENITITGGEKTDGNGAGIYIDGTSAENANELILNNGAKIISNKTQDYNGAGIYAIKTKITINDGAEISSNAAYGNDTGGGLYCGGCDVIMNGGAITRNMANNGAGLYLATFTLDGSTFNSTFTMNGGEISSNNGLTTNSVLKGAGICTEGSSSVKNNVIINNGKIKGNYFSLTGMLTNTQNLEGAGIYSSFSDITINNCEISGNYITNNSSSSYIKGAGLSINNSTVTINNAQFINNKLDNGTNTYDGGAIYVDFASSLSIKGGYFSGNVAKSGSGIYSSANIKFSGSPYFNDDDVICLASGKTIIVDKSVFPPIGKEYVAKFSPACTGKVLSAVNSNTTVLAEKTPYFIAKHFLDASGNTPIDVILASSGDIPQKVTSSIPESGYYYIVLSEGVDLAIAMNSNGLVMVVGKYDITDDTYSFYSFSGCENLIKVDLSLSTNLTTIPEENFSQCNKLTSVSLPSSLTKIGKNVFTDCTALTEIKFNAYGSNWYSTTYEGYTGGSLCEALNNPMLDEGMIHELILGDNYYYKQ